MYALEKIAFAAEKLVVSASQTKEAKENSPGA